MKKNTKLALINAIMPVVVLIAGALIIFGAVALFIEAADVDIPKDAHPGAGVILGFGILIIFAALISLVGLLLELTVALAIMFACHSYSYAKIAIHNGEDDSTLPRILLTVSRIEIILLITIAVCLAIGIAITAIIYAITKA